MRLYPAAIHAQCLVDVQLAVVGGLLGFSQPAAALTAHRMLKRCAADAQQPAAALQVGDDGAPGFLREVGGMQVHEAAAGAGCFQRCRELLRTDCAER
ncbi:hypothetical protein D3C73_907890 [compost metagenome]